MTEAYEELHLGHASGYDEHLMAGRFAGKTIIVTGAGSGIGRATALRVAREGGRVVAADWSAARLEELAAEFPQLNVVTVAGDISVEEDVAAIVAAAGDVIDGLVNNAGIMDEFQGVHEVTDEVWDRVFRVNVTGLMRMSRAVIGKMLERGQGTVVNLASEAGLRGSAAGVAYTASKHAVVGITKQSSVFYRPKGIRINAVAPGAVATNIEAKFSSQMAMERLGPLMQLVIPPLAQPEELAALITFLLSGNSSNISGAIIACDGGWSAI